MNEQAPARTPFVPAWLDDAGLSASEFRVLCRVARRGNCTESGPNIAKGCKLHPDTAWDALKSLEAQGFITKEKRHGKTGVFRVQPPTVAPSGIGGVAESEGHPLKPGGTQRKEGGTHLAESEGHKGSPIKVLPKGGKRASARECDDLSKLAVPEKLNTVLFLGKWADWIKCRQGKAKVKDWAGLFREQLEWLAGFEEPTAREILSASIRNGWQGLFPPKANGGAGKSKASTVPPWQLRKDLEAEERELAGRLHDYCDRERDPAGVARLATVRAELGKLKAAL